MVFIFISIINWLSCANLLLFLEHPRILAIGISKKRQIPQVYALFFVPLHPDYNKHIFDEAILIAVCHYSDVNGMY